MTAFPPNVDDTMMWDAWLSIHRFPILTVADEIGLFPAIASAGLSTGALASALSVDPRALKIHLGVLAATGFVTCKEERWLATQAAQAWLHPEGQGYYGSVLRFNAGTNPLHAQLIETLKTGRRASTHISSTDKWEAGQMSADAATRITAYMDVHGHAAARALAEHDAFADVRRLLDVGGGSAIYAIELAKARPLLTATVMEIEAVCAVARRYVEAAGLSGQIDTLPVNMLGSTWPAGYDAHFLSNIFHDWEEETCRLLARRSFDALPVGGRIILHEMLMDDDGCGPLHAALFSLVMLLAAKGRQYAFFELRDILAGAGFEDIEAAPTRHGYFSVVTGYKR
jgi:3-hydroxy-5-methyl-1-naphthoate 3-O-methyltransferase